MEPETQNNMEMCPLNYRRNPIIPRQVIIPSPSCCVFIHP